MKKEGSSIIIVFGENAKFGQGEEYLKNKTQNMSPHNKISAIAAGVVGTYREPDSELWFVGGDPTGSGNEEALQARQYALSRFPDLEGRTRAINGLQDTSTQSQAVVNLINELKYEERSVKAVLPLEHARRAKGQLEAFGVKVDKIYESNKTYITDPGISKKTKNKRIEIVRRIYFSKQMYFDIMREFGLNVIGLIDNEGLITQKISKRFRAKSETQI